MPDSLDLPRPPLSPVCGPGDFPFAAMALDHGHINDQCRELIRAGGELRHVYDPDPAKIEAFRRLFPQAVPVAHPDQILCDPAIKLVTAAAVPNDRAALGLRVMDAGKDYFTDKAPFTTLEQLQRVRKKVTETGCKYMVFYSERLVSECAIYAGDLVREGVIGRVVQVLGLGPHRLNPASRPAWFFQREKYGGIICDLGSHQVEQLLFYSGASGANVTHASVANHHQPGFPGFEDFGEFSLTTDNGTSGYFRVDWLSPDGLGTWGDGRTVILGTKGYIELRKYIDVGREKKGDQIYLVTQEGEQHLSVAGQVGFPFFGQIILDCLHRTEKAMTQAHAFKAAELSLQAQALAESQRKRETNPCPVSPPV